MPWTNPLWSVAWLPALIQALQTHGVAATAKHFPGDGMDDRDQHLATTINNLPFAQWQATYGQVWRQVIEAGVYTIMPGHISLPDYQGFADDPAAAPLAITSRKLLIDLLRGELGYQGLIVSDSMTMIYITSRIQRLPSVQLPALPRALISTSMPTID